MPSRVVIRSIATGLSWGFLSLSCLLIGCGGGSDSDPLYEVNGTVFLDGAPLQTGFVQFIPVGGDSRPRLTGLIEESGAFSLVGPSGIEGAYAGQYIVTVHLPASGAAGSDEHGKALVLPEQSVPLPEHYSDESASGLTVEVGPELKDVELRLSSKPANMQTSQAR